jgi:hypothetical protein
MRSFSLDGSCTEEDSETNEGSQMSADENEFYYRTDETILQEKCEACVTHMSPEHERREQEDEPVREIRTEFLLGDRLLRGASQKLCLPTPASFLNHPFFDVYHQECKRQPAIVYRHTRRNSATGCHGDTQA